MNPDKTPEVIAVLDPDRASNLWTNHEKEARKIIGRRGAEKPRSISLALKSLEENKPQNVARADRAIETNIGWMTDKTKLDTGEKNRQRQAKADLGELKDYVNIEFDSLSPYQRTRLIDQAGKLLNCIPEFKNYLESTPNSGRDVIKKLLQNPQLREKIIGIFENRLNERETNQAALELSKQVLESASELEKASIEKKKVEDIKAVNENDIARNQDRVDEFDDKTSSGGEKGKYFEEIEDISGNKYAFETSIAQLTENAEQIKMQLSTNLQVQAANDSQGRHNPALETVIQSLREELTRNKMQKFAFEQRLNRLQELQTKKQELLAQRLNLQKMNNELSSELLGAVVKFNDAQRLFNEAKFAKAEDEEKFITEIRSTIPDGLLQYLEEEMDSAEKAKTALNQKDELEAAERPEKIILAQLKTRWATHKTITKFFGNNRETTITNIENVNTDYDTLINPNLGPERIIQNMLVAGGLSNTEADEKMKDQTFIDKMLPKITEQLLSRKLRIGKITEDEALHIINTDWGRDAINNAIAKNSELNSQLQKLREQGILSEDRGLADWLKKKSNGSLSRYFLLLLFGGLTLGAGLGVVALKDSMKEYLSQ